MQSITINITNKLVKASGFIESCYNQFNQYGEFEFTIPDDINTNILIKLLKTDKTIINEDNINIDEILYITNYFQLNNVTLKLSNKGFSNYKKKYDIIKKIIIIQHEKYKGIIDIPINTVLFVCNWCVGITGFTGCAKIMDFSATSLSGIIEIPEEVEVFSCRECNRVTGFTGRANIMNFNNTSLFSIIDIPEGVGYFSCWGCEKVTGFTGYANVMNFTGTSLSDIIAIPEEVISFSCNERIVVTGFTGYTNYRYFTSVLIPNIGRLMGCMNFML